ncbi:carbon-nitrogen hydrolase family protein [Haladaptatus sp. DYSN1]|uniref:carbon-nitrogen hydrolase family protein n=1 Tax=unclassified Haladaptatus TaxID=2622732 RepID=UPI00240645F3|nr:carbon-nitrogen hydrolase family protein [Haladaptatus sp. DYSN1]
MSQFTVAACQLDSRDDKEDNVRRALSFVDEAASKDADIVAFPEMFPYIGPKDAFSDVAEEIPGSLTERLAARAEDYGMYIHAGSMFEPADDGRVYNTTALINPDGDIAATYRKVHLFDIDVPGGVTYQESERVAAGNEAVVAETALANFGLSICYDLRFPELFTTLARNGAEVIFLPAAFTLFTGKDHWEPLLRARAIESQCYVVAPAQIGEKPKSAQTYGKTMVIDPWGNVIRQASDREELITAPIDLDYVADVRRDLPSLQHKRDDVYF